MTIKLAGKEIDFFASSGSLGFDGRGYWWNRLILHRKLYPPPGVCSVLKTVTSSMCSGNGRTPWLNIRPIMQNGKLTGYVNCLGLPNPGISMWREKYLKKVDFKNQSTVFSFAVQGDDRKHREAEIFQVALELENLPFLAVELNSSCPNTKDNDFKNVKSVIQSCEFLRRHSRHPIILKLSYEQNFVNIAKEADGLADAISFNAIPWKRVFSSRKSPFEKFSGGGVSGKITRRFYDEMATGVLNHSKIPVIMPVWDYEDIEWNEKFGAGAHSFGSVFIANPGFPARAMNRWQKEYGS